MPEPKPPALKATALRATALQAVGLGYRFAGGAWAFRGVGLTLRSGEITLLAGANGAGKTLLAKNLAGLLMPTEGSVSVEGRDIAELKGSIAPFVGYVFQDARLQTVGETVLDDLLFGPTNLGLDPREARERAESAMRSCGLEDRADSFTHDLSGGELRRLAIAGVLAMRPRVLILDEPFVNLDPRGIGRVLELALEIARGGLALLVISHEIEKILGLVSSFAVMDKGRIALCGSPGEVLAQGIESYGLRDPFRPQRALKDLSWL